MNKLIILLTLILFASCFKQQNKGFVINELVVENDLIELLRNNAKESKDVFFEDSLYMVSRSCVGEWGGSIKFKNKKTGIEHSAKSVCPVIVNKLEGKYYVTNTLPHLMGFSKILEIDSPDSLEIFRLPEPRGTTEDGNLIYIVGDHESKSTKGTKVLADSSGLLTLVSFTYEKQLYHIVSDFKKTFLTKIENNKFITIDTVSNERIWAYRPEIFLTKDEHLIVVFDQKSEGYIDIFENEINIIRRE